MSDRHLRPWCCHNPDLERMLDDLRWEIATEEALALLKKESYVPPAKEQSYKERVRRDNYKTG
ncbi:hypothetical protein HY489_02845 [Candidatus Woesearchaeota archaeon]|nr:hypothetical protein [Candidatus Woesearchaeota archaeon]